MMSYHLTSVRTAIIKETEITNVGKDAQERDPSSTVSGNVNVCRHCGKQYGGFSEN